MTVASSTPALLARPVFRSCDCRRVRTRAAASRRSVVACRSSQLQLPIHQGLAAEAESRTPNQAVALGTLLTSNAALALMTAPVALADAAEPGYFQGSYNVTLGLFVFALPGLWSLVKRSTKSKVVRKTFTVPGPAREGAEPLDELARRVSTYFKNNNYRVKEAGETITFEGAIAASRGQAAALTFYAFVGLLCTGLVVSIAVPSIGDNAYYAVLLSPGAGYYYTANAERKEEVEVKIVTSDDDMETDIVIQGDTEEVERFWKVLGLKEKGMVYVEGVL